MLGQWNQPEELHPTSPLSHQWERGILACLRRAEVT